MGFGEEDHGGEVPSLLLKTFNGPISLKMNFNSLKLAEKVATAWLEPAPPAPHCLCFPSPFSPLTPGSSLLPEQGTFISPGLDSDAFSLLYLGKTD